MWSLRTCNVIEVEGDVVRPEGWSGHYVPVMSLRWKVM